MLLALLLATSGPARAEPPVLSMTAGAFGVVDTAGDGWVGQYVYFGPSMLFPLTASGKLAIIPQLAFEVAPETGNWGFVLTPALEWAASDRVGIDLVPSMAQDTKGGLTSLVVSAGPGATYLFRSGATASVAVQASYVVGAEIPASVNPLLQVGFPLR